MKLEITENITEATPDVEVPNPKILSYLGEEGIRELVDKHYKELRNSEIAHLFPQEESAFEQASKNSSDFFIQILGGPKYFNENRGQPFMKRRHMSFKIDKASRKVWLECYRTALEHTDMPDDLKLSYWKYIDRFSIWMINS